MSEEWARVNDFFHNEGQGMLLDEDYLCRRNEISRCLAVFLECDTVTAE